MMPLDDKKKGLLAYDVGKTTLQPDIPVSQQAVLPSWIPTRIIEVRSSSSSSSSSSLR